MASQPFNSAVPMKRLWAAAFIALALVGLEVPSQAKSKPLAIAPGGADSAVILIVPRLSIRYMIGMSRYDPVERQLGGGAFAGGPYDTEVDRLRPGQSEWLIVVRKLKPGTYVFRDVTQQRTWGVCYHAASYQFTLEPGQILYLGEFDGRREVAQVQRRAVEGGQTVSTGKIYHYFEDVPPPPLRPNDEVGLKQAREYVAKALPGVTSPVERASMAPATFGTGSDLFGTQRLCGGWHKKKAGPPSPAPRAQSKG